MLGRFGLPEQRVLAMTLPELNSFMRQARQLLSAYQVVPLPVPTPAAKPAAVPPGKSSGTTFISKRVKKHEQ